MVRIIARVARVHNVRVGLMAASVVSLVMVLLVASWVQLHWIYGNALAATIATRKT